MNTSLMEFLTSTQTITYLAGGAAFLAVIAFALPFLEMDQKSNRLNSVRKRRQELSRKQLESLTPQATLRVERQNKRVDAMKKILVQLRLQDLIASPKIKEELLQAGYRGTAAVIGFLFSRVVSTLVIGGGTGAMMFTLIADVSTMMKFGATAAGVAFGFYLPKMLVSNMAQKRQQALASNFPDALDLMVICVESGLGVETAFQRVAEEIVDQAPILAQEIGMTTAELAYLGDRQKALENFTSRTGHPGVKSLCTTLIQSEKYGTPVAAALRVLSEEQRGDRMAKAEKKAAALPAQLTVPMIIFFLPLLFMVILGPAAIRMITKTGGGG